MVQRMDTYGRKIRSLYDRITGQAPDSTTTPVTEDTAWTLLDAADTVTATHLPASLAPAKSLELTGDTPADEWDRLSETYTLHDTELTIYERDDRLDYEIRTRYDTDGIYGGELVFRSTEEDALWAALNDI